MKVIITFVILLCGVVAFAQTADDYKLLPGPAITLSPGQQQTFIIQWVDSNLMVHSGTVDQGLVWTVNGRGAAELQSSDGNIKFANGVDLQQCIYTAPASMPKQNPITLNVRFHTKGAREGTEIVILQCAITIADAYKIQGDISLNSSMTGMDISMHIDDQVRYTILSNGAATLEPVNGKGTLHVKIADKIMVRKDGALGKYVSPIEYDIPVLISIDHANGNQSSPATFYISTFSSPNNDETYELTSGTAATPYKQNFINSVLKVIFMKDAMSAAHQNQQTAQDNIAWAERMQALRNKPQSEWTEQDKKDIAQMQALQQKLGASTNTQNPFSNVPVDDKGNTVGDNNGKLTTSGVQNTTHQVPASAMGNGMATMNFKCTFNPQASTVLELNKEDSDMAGVQHAKIHLMVKKEK
jgi:hypothetical protein